MHFPIIDQFDTRCQNYLSQMIEGLHYYDAKANVSIMVQPGPGVDVVDGDLPAFLTPPGSPPSITVRSPGRSWRIWPGSMPNKRCCSRRSASICAPSTSPIAALWVPSS